MCKKIILGTIFVVILISWPISLIKKPAQIKFETIFYPETNLEKIDFEKKLALDTSRFKRIYYNKTSILKERYLKNFLVLIDLNNYFFEMHPREDVIGVDYRFKYPFWTIIFLISAIGATVKTRKYFKIWLIVLMEILILSFFKKVDGLDFVLFPMTSWLLILGTINLFKWWK